MRPLLSALPLMLLCAPLAEAKKKKAAPAPPPAKPIPVEFQNSICTIDNLQGGGTGFIATFKGKTVIATNQHVVFGQKDLKIQNPQGKEFKPSGGLVASGADVALLFLADPLPEGIKPFVLSENILAVAKSGDEVTICGNALADRTITTAGGHITSVGPALLEHNTPTFGGNSGSPIYHHGSGQVIAIHTLASPSLAGARPTDKQSAQAGGSPVAENGLRRFGSRVDTESAWINLDWKSINSVEDQLAKLEIAVEDAIVILERGSWADVQDEFLRKKLEESVAKFRSTTASETDAYNLWIKAIDSARTSMSFKLKQLEPMVKTHLHRKKFSELKPGVEGAAGLLEILRDDVSLMKSIYAGKYKMPERVRTVLYSIRRR